MCDSLLHPAGLAHQKRFAEVAPGFVADPLGQLGRQEETLFLTHRREDVTHLQGKHTKLILRG